ncbi:MAG: TldD/PmbA family protein [Deltaproteobacteria bacterium]|nr:TldD/PmbA family protein [Deltaproteobacteria bacterium]
MLAHRLIDKALKTAQGAQATVQRAESTKVSFENDKLKFVKSTQRTTINVKVVVNGKIGSSHTSDECDADGVVARALEAAAFGSPAHFEFPGPSDGRPVRVYDEAVLGVTREAMVQIGREMMTVVKDYNPDILVSAGINKGVRQTEFANSSGAAYQTQSTSFGVGVHGQWVRGTDILLAGHAFGWKKRDVDYGAIADRAVALFRMAQDTASIETGTFPVIFSPEALEVLVLALRLGFNGKSVFLGASPLAEKLGQKIADARFSLTDDPLIDYASRSSRWDAEGVPRQVTPLIENGVVKNFLYDLDTAGRAGTRTTGHGVGCSPTNLVVKTGDTSWQDMVADTKTGLVVYDVLGLGQGNPISGEFSVNLQLAYKIEDGRIVGRVKDVMLAGNTYDALNNIVAVGDQAEWAGDSLLAPPIQISDLNVVAR